MEYHKLPVRPTEEVRTGVWPEAAGAVESSPHRQL